MQFASRQGLSLLSRSTRNVQSSIFKSAFISKKLFSVQKSSKQYVSVLKQHPVPLIQRRRFATQGEALPIRNVAIIAHVDHGKTTLVDRLLQQSGTLDTSNSDRVMDSNQLEKERGITILSKVTGLNWKGIRINLVDTPGHGDFGGEVERIMSMVDGVVLLVDCAEGVMSQTKFVLSKALQAGKKPIVVLNKLDRPDQRIEEVEDEIFELFMALEANDEQMNYPTLYASSRGGWAVKNRNSEERVNLHPLFDTIIEAVPAPKVESDAPFSFLVNTLETDPWLGRILTGKVFSGKVTAGMKVKALDLEGNVIEEEKVKTVLGKHGLERMQLPEGIAGDIISIAGLTKATVTMSLVDPAVTTPVKTIPLDPPVISMTFSVNTSPLNGTEGQINTFPAIRKRLEKEVESNISLSLKRCVDREAIEVFGRGELQLGILIENMRREGFEFSVSPPQVVYKYENEEQLEPMEEVIIDVDDQYSGTVIEKLSVRKGEMKEMKQLAGKTRLIYLVPSRALVGFRNELLTDTRGTAVYNHVFHSFVPFLGKLEGYKKGALISMQDGITTSYALEGLEPRGILFVGPQTRVYPGMVIGEHTRDNDLEVNPIKARAVSNVRSVQKDEFFRLKPPKVMTLEESIAYVRADELLEITPKSIRLRKDPNRKSTKKA